MKFNDITKPPPPLPSPAPTEFSPGMTLLRPLSRRGTGPGMIILTPDHHNSLAIKGGIPSPLIKWAEEGYAVVEIQAAALSSEKEEPIKAALEALAKCDKCETKDKVGLVVYEPGLWSIVAPSLSSQPAIAVAVVYADDTMSADLNSDVDVPTIYHLAGKTSGDFSNKSMSLVKTYHYPTVSSYKFAMPFQDDFHYNTENISHTRNLTHLKGKMGGPFFDLEEIWEEHTYYEFADRSMEHTMSTMVEEPYVNHVPTMTGGIGRISLSKFYQHSFIFNNSADTELELISRTLGIDRIVDEFIFKFTHDQTIPWILPGIPPTNRKVEVPFTAVVNIRGDRLYHEHISWDQASVLRQIGLLPEYLPFPYPVPNGSSVAKGKTFEYRLPVAGVQTAGKIRDRNSVSSNEMFEYAIREV